MLAQRAVVTVAGALGGARPLAVATHLPVRASVSLSSVMRVGRWGHTACNSMVKPAVRRSQSVNARAAMCMGGAAAVTAATCMLAVHHPALAAGAADDDFDEAAGAREFFSTETAPTVRRTIIRAVPCFVVAGTQTQAPHLKSNVCLWRLCFMLVWLPGVAGIGEHVEVHARLCAQAPQGRTACCGGHVWGHHSPSRTQHGALH